MPNVLNAVTQVPGGPVCAALAFLAVGEHWCIFDVQRISCDIDPLADPSSCPWNRVKSKSNVALDGQLFGFFPAFNRLDKPSWTHAMACPCLARFRVLVFR